MEAFLEEALDGAARAGLTGLMIAAFLLAFGETALLTDLVVPGDVGMILIGAVSARADVDVWWVILAASVGATLGDSVGWWLGSRFGLRLLHRFPRIERRLAPGIARAHGYFEERGGAIVFWGRFIGALRAIVSFVAGTAGMPYRRFLAWNAAASVCWTTAVIGAGYAFGESIDVVLSEIGLAVTATVISVFVVIVMVRRTRRARVASHADPDGHLGDRASH